MEFNRYISPDGLIYDFDNQTDRFLISSSGFGLPPVQNFTQNMPYLHGSKFLGYKLQPRSVKITHQSEAAESGKAGYWALRALILDTMRYNRGGNGTLRKIYDDGTIRDLAVYVSSGLTLDEGKPISAGCKWHIRDAVEFIAYDPIFFNPTNQAITFTPSVNTDLVFPITFPITFGEGTITDSYELTYTGSWLTYPVMTIRGPIDGPIITNETINESIALDYTVADGEEVVIDLSHGAKTVVNTSDVNLIGTVTPDSDLGTFRIDCDPAVPGGVNNFAVSGGGTNANTRIKIEYYIRYIGI